jgi:hypothetical protein
MSMGNLTRRQFLATSGEIAAVAAVPVACLAAPDDELARLARAVDEAAARWRRGSEAYPHDAPSEVQIRYEEEVTNPRLEVHWLAERALLAAMQARGVRAFVSGRMLRVDVAEAKGDDRGFNPDYWVERIPLAAVAGIGGDA